MGLRNRLSRYQLPADQPPIPTPVDQSHDLQEEPTGLPLAELPGPLHAAPYVVPREGAPNGADGSAMLEGEEAIEEVDV